MLDMVVNHNGYINLEEPMGVNPFYNTSDYHDCAELARQGLCDACQVPSVTNLSGGVDLFVKQNTMCQLSNLPDLNHTVPRVRDGLVNWVKWIYGQYDFVSARFDAIGHIPPVCGVYNTKHVYNDQHVYMKHHLVYMKPPRNTTSHIHRTCIPCWSMPLAINTVLGRCLCPPLTK